MKGGARKCPFTNIGGTNQPLRVFAQHLLNRSDAGRQTEALELAVHISPNRFKAGHQINVLRSINKRLSQYCLKLRSVAWQPHKPPEGIGLPTRSASDPKRTFSVDEEFAPNYVRITILPKWEPLSM